MVVKLSNGGARVLQAPISGDVAAAIHWVKDRRKKYKYLTRNSEKGVLPPDEYREKFLEADALGRHKYNPPLADLELLFPTGVDAMWSSNKASSLEIPTGEYEAPTVEELLATSENSTVNDSFKSDKVLLDRLFPTITPDDSYFEKGEIEILEASNKPLRYPAKTYIRKLRPFKILTRCLLLLPPFKDNIGATTLHI